MFKFDVEWILENEMEKKMEKWKGLPEMISFSFKRNGDSNFL